ncbi:MAG: ubiquinone biosynthesis regulatory protein kinase UbiB [Halothiobacillus sp. 14-56-357]|jgi:ubiquinone biosynthesis protein|uniref:ubiquinone biosynthesis regulatory protein kinase UbiB n=1 Tax=Halothiobacillus sp. 15-55-196 TaxID=1970382 RepID=UPI000BDBBAEA|nr:ubiquinone biosynthesis regulatory protein kinase UbiB [Halothiobacillus sp. 15-55-196]OZB36886.1 MAG: ubiquinone biosynthesis regulatory protein kinase UbiB [Halothiobacillus sp. 15-55-196]OZB57274.1 MAG: ubiquinone biosynthesis regulatory protein kinase UbiB [Halothiobacillus sp. 14-56-357]OZB79342.1 MAG: ubiquinone biosynthesis regulatory protein kinase UbiB [Halothiobacillus sp. 13-55-115]
MKLTVIWRLIVIQYVFYRHGLDELVLTLPFLRPVRFVKYLSPWYWLSNNRQRSRGQRLVESLEDLGPIFVKFGQMLSTRKDLLPMDYADALSALQDRVRPFPAEQARKRIERALGFPIESVFSFFEAEPMASASIAQVHAATLKNGDEVVVKIVRPGIEPRIRQDLEILYTIARLAEKYWSEGPRLHPVDVVAEFDKTLMDELDLMREAANAAELRRHFEHSPLLYVPEIYWDLCRTDVLVQERIFGIPIAQTDRLKAAGVDMKILAERGVEVFFTQVFDNNFFHADMHPGNIFVDVSNPALPKYMAIDFGIVGSLMPEDQRYIAENFHAFFNRDYRRVAELHVESGWVPSSTRVEEFESAIRTVCEPIFQKPLKEISFGHFLFRLFQVARRFEMEVQPQLTLLQKTLLAIEGLGRNLYPDLDLWVTAKPFIERWMRERIGPKAFLKRLKNELPFMLDNLAELPRIHLTALKQTEKQTELLIRQEKSIKSLREEMMVQQQKQRYTLIGSVLLLGFLLTQSHVFYEPHSWFWLPALAWVDLILGLLFIYFGLKRKPV